MSMFVHSGEPSTNYEERWDSDTQ